MPPAKHQTFRKSLIKNASRKEKTWFESTRGRIVKKKKKREKPRLKETFVSLVKLSFLKKGCK